LRNFTFYSIFVDRKNKKCKRQLGRKTGTTKNNETKVKSRLPNGKNVSESIVNIFAIEFYLKSCY